LAARSFLERSEARPLKTGQKSRSPKTRDAPNEDDVRKSKKKTLSNNIDGNRYKKLR